MASGSPPRAWGRLPRSVSPRCPLRFTPTCVGTTTHGREASVPPTVHPHVRGDDLDITNDANGNAGSPPRAWGRLRLVAVWHQAVRFTPTCVGTTRWPPPDLSPPAVHPHVRGDDLEGVPSDWDGFGSPPRAWGRPLDSRCHLVSLRFTPTCVGTTEAFSPLVGLVRFTPTCVGTTRSALKLKVTSSGSPPRAWGRQRLSPLRSVALAVHPHVRGDDLSRANEVMYPAGSPPRAWGRP